jgi:hypothetical protein
VIELSNGVDSWEPVAVEGYVAGRRSRNVIRDILGSVDVAASLRPARRRSGTLRVLMGDDETGAFELLDALADEATWTFTHDDRLGVAMSFVLDGVARIELDSTTNNHWHLDIPYQETAP